jgi:O-antigen/teichoic acid export membrane protein
VQLIVRTVVMRGISFLTTLALARLLSPIDFGVFAIISFVIWLFLMLGDLGLGAALVQAEQEPTAEQLAAVWTSQLVLAAALMACIWLAASLATQLIPGLPTDSVWMLRVLSLGLLPVSLRALPSVMLERRLQFGALAASEVVAQAAFCVAAVGLAVQGFGAWSFVLAALVQFSVGAAMVNAAWRGWPGLRLDVRALGALVAFGIHYQAATILVWLRDAPVPFIGAVVIGPIAAGLLDLAWAVGAAAAMVDETIGRVAFPAFSRLQDRREDQGRAVSLAISMTALVSIPTQLWAAATAPVLIPLVFGQPWSAAVAPVQGVCVGMVFRFPTRYLRQVAFANGEARLGLALASATAVLALLPLVPALLWFGVQGAGVAFAAGSIAGFLFSVLACTRLVSVAWTGFAGLFAAGVASAVPTYLLVMIVSGPGGLLLGSAAYAAVFGSFILLYDRDLVRLALRLLGPAATAEGVAGDAGS